EPAASRGSTMELVHSGKVRDVYADGDDLILVASDRVSVYDVVLPTRVPDKGKILTQLSLWWFEQLGDIIPNHALSATDAPAAWARRAIRCRRLTMLPVEWIARGYLTGLGLKEYQKDGTVSGIALPAGLTEASRLPEPIFTPTTKATEGHDEFITYDDVVRQIGEDTAARLRDVTLEIYRRGAAVAADGATPIADTKLVCGRAAAGTLTLGAEVLPPASSRCWPADQCRPGRPQHSLDKQFVRDWSSTRDWDRTPPGPEIPQDVVDATRARYIEVYERLTGRRWTS